MRTHHQLKMFAVTATLALIAGLTSAVPAQTAQAAPEDLDCAESLVEKTLKNGAAWRMCARIHPVKGLVLEKVEFKPATGAYEYPGYKRVLDQIYLSQLNVPYDNGSAYYNDITEYGFGAIYLVDQAPELCLGETINFTQSAVYFGELIERTIRGICTDEVNTGMASHSQEGMLANSPRFVSQGTALEVSSMSKISWYEYQQKLTFDDHGQIDIGLGATGDLAPTEAFYPSDPREGWPVGSTQDDPVRYSASHRHNAIYRVDFGIDAGERQSVEQWDYTAAAPNTPNINGSKTAKNEAFSAVPGENFDARSWWRVLNPDSLNKDGHPRSYEIVSSSDGDPAFSVTQPVVSFTNDHACQEYASSNLNPGCPAQSVLDYVAGETEALTDPIAWVNVGFHHIVRNEDQSPMPTHWQRFQLVPRDFFAQNPSISEARRCVNGYQFIGSTVSDHPCTATNYTLPRVTADSAGIKPGTALTATTGSWNNSRTTWNYTFLWFRDGQPITEPTAATGSQYVVTEADRGKAITVKVTASQTGYGSGTAESLPTRVPGPTTPSPTPTTPRPTVTPKPAPVASTTTARLTRSKITTRQNTRVKVTVKARGLKPTGRFQIRYGSKVLRTGTLKNGKATITVPKFKKARKYRLRIVYLGSKSVKPSKSKLLSVRVVRK